MCEAVAAVVRCLDGPCVISGDCNMTPDVLAKSGVLGMVRGTVFAPELPTCNEKVYDFFVVTNNFAHAVAGVQRIEGVGISPHFPARLLIRGDARRFMVRTLVRPKRVPPTLMFGPQPKPPCYGKVFNALKDIPTRLDNTVAMPSASASISNAMVDWYTLAREEFRKLT